jgi:hypothetical protein
MTARLTSQLLVSALLRRAEVSGGFGVVITKGDQGAGSIILQLLEKGVISGLWERALTASGGYQWLSCGPQDVDILAEIDGYILRRRRNDPDLWVIELDVPDAERFTADLPTGT